MTDPQAAPGKTRDAAHRLAVLLTLQDPHTRVPSRETIAAYLGIHPSTAQRARNILQGRGVIYRSGRHLYVSPRQPSATELVI